MKEKIMWFIPFVGLVFLSDSYWKRAFSDSSNELDRCVIWLMVLLFFYSIGWAYVIQYGINILIT